MIVNNIINESTAEVENEIVDLVYTAGCLRDCVYCFNRELRNFNNGMEMSAQEIIDDLSPLSDVVVITGGDPMLQTDLIDVIKKIRNTNKKIVLETSFYNATIYRMCHKVLFTYKTFNPILDWQITDLNKHWNVMVCVVVGHKDFDMKGYKKLLTRYVKNIYLRPVEGTKIKDFKINDVYSLTKTFRRKYEMFDKICL